MTLIRITTDCQTDGNGSMVLTLSSNGGDGAVGDPDGDGMSSLQEYTYLQPPNWDSSSTPSVLDRGVWWNGTVPVNDWDEENALQYNRYLVVETVVLMEPEIPFSVTKTQSETFVPMVLTMTKMDSSILRIQIMMAMRIAPPMMTMETVLKTKM